MEGDVGALIAEPMRWTTAEPPPPGYWQRVRRICDEHGTLLVFDEVPSALGRTGRMFVCEHFGVVPDILVLGKGLGGGVFPMAAVLARPQFDVGADRSLGHYTHEKSPVGCAAALATLDCLEQDGLIERARDLGHRALRRMQDMQTMHPLISDVRGLGLHLGMALCRDNGPALDEADAVLYESLSRGLSFKVGAGNVLTLSPPLTITQTQLDTALDILEAAIDDVQEATL